MLAQPAQETSTLESDAPDGQWLAADEFGDQRIVVQKRLRAMLGFRLRYDWRIFWQTTFKPSSKRVYNFQSLSAARLPACAPRAV